MSDRRDDVISEVWALFHPAAREEYEGFRVTVSRSAMSYTLAHIELAQREYGKWTAPFFSADDARLFAGLNLDQWRSWVEREPVRFEISAAEVISDDGRPTFRLSARTLIRLGLYVGAFETLNRLGRELEMMGLEFGELHRKSARRLRFEAECPSPRKGGRP